MNSRFKWYFLFLCAFVVIIGFYSAFKNGCLSSKSDRTFKYIKLRTKTTDSSDVNLEDLDVKSPYKGYGNISQCPPNGFKRNLTKLLQTWHKMAEQHNITWILFYGTLLGSLRNNDIIPYDSDIDILVDASDLTKLKSLEHPRNFTNKDFQTRLVVVPDFNKPVHSRRFITCEGKVSFM
jgi:predicted nucleotidyltransferase